MPKDTRPERPAPKAPRLLDRLRDAIRARNYSPRTAEAYVFWVRRFVVFHGKRHPDTMGLAEVKSFLSYLAITRRVAASTQNQALGALLFLYRHVLGRDLARVDDLVRAKKPIRVPTVLTPDEIARILRHLRGFPFLAAALMYGSGLRLMECLQLRIQDIDFDRAQIVVREGKGQKGRRTLLPAGLVGLLREHLARLQHRHDLELRMGAGEAALPESVARRSPSAATLWAWQWLFPASRPLTSGPGAPRNRHHLHKTAIQRAFAIAVRRSGVTKPATCHSLRHSFATHLVEASYDIRTVQELMGHRDVSTTMIYTQALYRGGRSVRSPLDAIPSPAPPARSLPEGN